MKLKIRESVLPLLPSLDQHRKSNVALNREIVKQLISITVFLGQHCLSFRGHREHWKDHLRGNFKDLVLLLSEHSPALLSHVTSLKTKGRKEDSFISWDRQNLLIESVSKNIADKIVTDIKASQVFSVSVDSTFDVSHKEQVSFIIRYVDETDGKVMERLIALKESPHTTGTVLAELFDNVFKQNNIEWKKYLVGQSYDGAANMSGQYNGLQAKIIEKNPHALYIWCSAHRLNLIVSQAVGSCLNAIDLFGKLEKMFTFISGSKKRAAIFREKQKMLYPKKQIRSLKRVDTTRWMSHSYALTTILDTYYAVYLTIEEIQITEGTSDYMLGSECLGLLSYITSYRFIITAFTFKTIFDVLEPLNRILQARDIDILSIVSVINKVKNIIQLYRTDEKFNKIVEDVKGFVEACEIENFTPLENVRSRKKIVPRKADELCQDETVQDPLKKFKIDTFFLVLDLIITQINNRFTDNNLEVLKDLALLSIKIINEIKINPDNIPKDAFKSVCSVYHTFLNINDVKREYEQYIQSDFNLSNKLPDYLHSCLNDTSNNSDYSDDESMSQESLKTYQNSSSLLCVYKEFCLNGFKTIFPNLFMLIKIGVTLPVSSCSPERSFSKLKLVKTRLRSSMGENRLEDLIRITCESDIDINVEAVIDDFASKSVVLTKALKY
ncbi:zinc finger MYM-type protein 1-like [Metopolophium dirhodum]|uniref:zinc finger MYM-type protein 1-like n=1 Tax=Metopolophium dirhodum TaxID=44670 RepID=UPI00298F6831|nr:zinc finger MYM-type protein 1-like [Metopolophium dirhodum]